MELEIFVKILKLGSGVVNKGIRGSIRGTNNQLSVIEIWSSSTV